MGLPKGKTNNPAGRPEGSKNKNSKEMREMVTAFVCEQWDKVVNDFDSLEPKERLQFFEKMLQYSLPKLSAQTLDVKEERIINLPAWMLSANEEHEEDVNVKLKYDETLQKYVPFE